MCCWPFRITRLCPGSEPALPASPQCLPLLTTLLELPCSLGSACFLPLLPRVICSALLSWALPGLCSPCLIRAPCGRSPHSSGSPTRLEQCCSPKAGSAPVHTSPLAAEMPRTPMELKCGSPASQMPHQLHGTLDSRPPYPQFPGCLKPECIFSVSSHPSSTNSVLSPYSFIASVETDFNFSS